MTYEKTKGRRTMKRFMALALSVMLIAICLTGTLVFAADSTTEPDLSTLKSYFDVNKFIYVDKENGSLQSTGFSEDIAFKFQDYTDGEYLYGAVVVLTPPLGSASSTGNGNSTNIRLWFRSNAQATVYTHFIDISYDGDSTPYLFSKKNGSLTKNENSVEIPTTGMEVETVVGTDYWFVQYKIPYANVDINNAFQYFVTVSNGKQADPEIKNNALLYPAVEIDSESRLANFPYNKWVSDAAIDVAVKGVTVDGDVKYNYPDLAKLSDGTHADNATEFSDARLVSFQWENFDKSEGANNGTKDVAFVLDLVEQKAITGVKIGAYKDLNSYINLPTAVKIYLSNDGVNYVSMTTSTWTSTVDGLVAATDRTAGPKGGATYFANWAVRASLNARFVKVVLTMNDEWIFLSEIEAITADEEGKPVDQVRISGVNTKLEGESIVVLTSKVTAENPLPLAVYNEETEKYDFPEGDYGLVAGGNWTWCRWDAEKKAYVVYENQVNPYPFPGDRTGTLTIPEGEILIVSISNGNKEHAYGSEKWIMRFLEVGTELHIYNDIITIGKTVADKPQRLFTFNAPSYAPASADDIGIMAVNEDRFEGITAIHTTGTFNGAYRNAALLEYNAEKNAYEVKAVHASSGTGPNWTIGENQIVVESNLGNNWPALFETATEDAWYYNGSNAWGTPYSECPNFLNDKNQAWYDSIGNMQVGQFYRLVGFDFDTLEVLANYVVDPSYDYITFNADYATYTYLELVTDTDPGDESSEPAEETSEDEPAPTGDAGFIALGILAVIAAAGAYVVRKSR
jgi:hypothetical protein